MSEESRCAALRPRLAELLTGALAADEAAQAEAHVLECPDCGAELAALLALSEGLRAGHAPATALAPARAPRRRPWTAWPALVVGAAAAAALALGAAQLLLGPERAPLDAQAAAGGAARTEYRVARGAWPLEVATPRGRVRVVPGPSGAARETAFRVLIEREGDVGKNGGILVGGGAAVVLVAVSAGAILFEPSSGGAPLRVEAGQQVRAGAAAPVLSAVGGEDVAGATGPDVGQGSAGVARLEREVERLRAEGERTEADRQRLAGELARTRAELDALRQRAGGSPVEPGPRLRWGRWSNEEALTRIDWRESAAAMQRLRDAVPELIRAWERGEQPSEEALLALSRDNQKLVAVELEAHKKLPSHAPGNGAFTHPAVQVNLLAEQLTQAGLPLSEAQELQLLRACQDYDQAWDQREAAWAPDALALEKLLAELRLKRGLSATIDGILTPPQREALTAPEARHLFTVDLYSPSLLLVSVAAPFPVDSPAAAAAHLGQFAARWGLGPDQLGEPLLTRWAQAALGGQPPVVPGRASLFDLDQAERAGAAQVAVMRELLQRPDLPAETRAALQADQGLAIPRLVQ